MSTRSRIGVVNPDGSVTSIYCHWDGYPSHNGNILLEHYKDPEKIGSLIKLGDISVLGPEVGPEPGSGHTFDHPQENVTVAYARDRNETGVDPIVDPDVDSFIKGNVEEWGYLFKDGEWLFVDGHPRPEDRKLKPLAGALSAR